MGLQPASTASRLRSRLLTPPIYFRAAEEFLYPKFVALRVTNWDPKIIEQTPKALSGLVVDLPTNERRNQWPILLDVQFVNRYLSEQAPQLLTVVRMWSFGPGNGRHQPSQVSVGPGLS